MKTRTTQPSNNKYYIRTVSGGYNGAVAGLPTIKGANVLCNCVGYANGRFNEIGDYGKCKYQLVCNAENFIESAKKQGLKISDVPIQGGIMVWQKGATLGGGDGAGHVAVVEEIYDDGSIMTSESGWNAWAFKTVRRTNDNGRWGQNSAYKFRGCIINPAVKDGKILPTPKLTVDGIGGNATIRATEKYFNCTEDGILSGQNKALKKYYPNITAVEYGKGGSPCVKKIQKWVGVTQDGVIGEKTIKAWQKKLKAEGYYNGNIDGIFGANSVKAWQKYLNQRLFTDNAEPTGPVNPSEIETPSTELKPPYKIIDVSDWQDKIDWAKVKADGVVGAIIRYADGTTLDKRFAENMKNAKAAGLHIGSYIFSRAKTKAQAEKEAERLFNACKPYGCDMPLYIDLEVSSLSKYADTVAIAFLTKMKALGGRGGVYANLNWWNNYLKKTAKDYSSNPFWIAQYNKTMDYKPKDRMGMWQYSSSGKVNGISGKVDMDECYVTYWDTSVKPSEPSEEPKPSEPTETTTPTKTIAELAQEVLDGKWGSGQARKDNLTKAGFDYDAVQAKVNEILYERLSEREKTILKGNEWARKIAADNRYHYNKWNSKDKQTQLCPICTGVDFKSDPKHFGWNCIGAAFAVWHHGMGLPCRCNCSVISNGIGEKMNKMSDAEALALAQERIGMKNIAVIKNNGKNVPQSKWQTGDIMLSFSGDTYTHLWYYMGDGELFEAQGSDGKVANDDQVRIASAKKRTSRIIIRWLG